MSERCEDCGCKVFNGKCVNCNEDHYIAEQYDELDMPIPMGLIKTKPKTTNE